MDALKQGDLADLRGDDLLLTAEKKKMPLWVWPTAKIAVAAAVVALMFHKDVIRLSDLEKAFAANWHVLLVALAASLFGIFLTSVRWSILLDAQAIHVPLAELFRLTMVGFFFSIVAPGGLGGDAVKAYYAARFSAHKKAEAATTVFLDRFLGLATLFLVAALMIALDFNRLWNANVEKLAWFGMPGGRVLILLIAACTAAMAAFALLVTSKRVRRSSWLKRLSRFVPFRHTTAKVYDATHLYGKHPRSLFWASAVSVASQIPLYLIYYLYAVAIGVDVKLWHCALIVPPAMVIRVLPLVPGGAGQGMVAMGLLFPLVGISVDKGAAIGALGDAMYVIIYLIGGLFFLFGKTSYTELRSVAAQEESAANEHG